MQSEPSEAFIAFDFSTILSHRDRRPQFRPGTLHDLATHLSQHTRLIPCTRSEYAALVTDTMSKEERAAGKERQSAIKDGPAILLGKFQPGYRDEQHLEYVSGLGLDIDEFHVELDTIKLVLGSYAAIIYETANSTPQRRRWRALIPFGRPATVEEYHQAYQYFAARMPGVAANSDNAVHLWYGDQRFKDSEPRITLTKHGLAFDPALKTKPTSKEAFKQRIGLPVGAPAAEGNRNAALNAYATSIVRDCESEAELFSALLDKNGSYAPPLGVAEVRGIAKRKWAKREQFGWVEHAPVEEASPDELAGLFSTTAQIAATQYTVRRQFVEDTLQVGCTLLHGPAKKGKSWAMLDMADHVAHGSGTFLGRQVHQAKVLLIGAEDTAERFKDRIGLMGIGASDQLVTMHREQLKRWGEVCALKDDAGNVLPWTPATFIHALHAQTQASVIILDTQEIVEITLNIEHGDRTTSLTRRDYMSTSSYDDIAQQLGIAVLLVAHWGAIKSVHLAATNPHQMINTTKTKISGALTSLTLGPLVDQEMDDDSGRVQWAVQGKDIRTGNRYEVVERDKVTQRHKLVGTARDVGLRESLGEVMEQIEALLNDGREWVTSADLGALMGMRSDTVRKKVLAIMRNAQKQATAKGLSDGRVYWKGKPLLASSKGYRFGQ